MRYFKNQLLIYIIQILNNCGRGFGLKKKIFSSRKILERNFLKKKEFSFIQIGANDGISFDFLYEFVIFRKSSGLVIEPVSDYFRELVFNYKDYPDIIKINKAIHPFEKSKKIFKIKETSRHKYADWAKGIASFDENHHLKINISKEDMEEEIVLADTLANIIADFYSNKKIDYLQIDTEGYDLEIIKMLDFKIIKPRVIKYEHAHLDNAGLISSKALLRGQGYSLFKEGNDTLAIDSRRIKLI